MAANDFTATKTGRRALRPRDAATLIIVRRERETPRVLMGKRHAGHAFMPNKYVFPGGRVDPADGRLVAGPGLHPEVESKLLLRMRGKPSVARARGLAMAAVRETFEEVGLIIGKPLAGSERSRSPAWQAFLDSGFAPDLSGLRYFARAITPPGRTRRFDTRFFVLDSQGVANANAPVKLATQELLDPYWVTIEEALGLDLPPITKDILIRLRQALQSEEALLPGAPLPFQYWRAKAWRTETL